MPGDDGEDLTPSGFISRAAEAAVKKTAALRLSLSVFSGTTRENTAYVPECAQNSVTKRVVTQRGNSLLLRALGVEGGGLNANRLHYFAGERFSVSACITYS
jgi:hypothetical protein